MDNLVKLQIINLFKKYDYIISEFEMKSEISNISQQIFKENIRKILVELKLDTAEDYKISDKPEEDTSSENEGDTSIELSVDEGLRHIYRKIVKLTHPDKIKNDYLNNLYIQATQAIDKSEKLNIFRICIILGIEIDMSDDIVDLLKREIKTIQKKILFLESSFHMKWHNSPKDKKIDIILDYLKKNELYYSKLDISTF